ncbi:hypothetical protein [Brevibacillus gelatini]|uniref:Uncharacterized protein n=1 Tax=Brevibacillus gelatini TaxID=1655277 RepID=A0A3M8AQN6_9BACL|nr:hypothetical protein [Brevibacillus gelatini]RNB53492.1 hypothetical protein EDM57_19550 [Brevibacillus gelatini]
MMTIKNVQEAFFLCGFPYYKQLSIRGQQAICTFYSIHSDYRKKVILNLTSKAELQHQIALEVIKFLAHDGKALEEQYIQTVLGD